MSEINPHPETILFVGAGAMQALAMPPTSKEAKFLWNACDEEPLTAGTIEESVTCFRGCGNREATDEALADITHAKHIVRKAHCTSGVQHAA